MSKITKIILLINFLFLITNVSANVNITFQSDNEKEIKIIDIDNGYYQYSSNTTNQTINLPYNNFNIKLYASNTNITNNGSFIVNNFDKIKNDDELIIWLGIIIVLCIMGFIVVGERL